MSSSMNRQVRLASRPQGIPQAHHFEVTAAPVPPLGPGQILVRNRYLSVEPAMRGWVNAAGNYAEPVAVGAVMRSFAAGVVEASNDPDWPVGTPVTGQFGWQEFALVEAAQIWVRERGVARIEIQVARGNLEGQAFWRALGYGPLMDVLHKRL